eukprot:m.130529 g.130529  ORF g.130529 m.130529 type:complete len:980 (-) comp9468_c0_seq17:214-3153(-)
MVIGSVRLVVPLVVIIFAFIIASNSQMSFSINAQIHDECGFGFVNSGVVNDAATSLTYQCSATSPREEIACNVVNTADCAHAICGSRCSCTNGNTIISCEDLNDSNAVWPEGLPLSTKSFSWTKFATLDQQQQEEYTLTPQHFRVDNDLTSITLHGTQLGRIRPDTPSTWRKLNELEVDSEPLTGFPWGQLPPSLTKLKVTNTLLGGVFVSDFIANLTALEELHLDNNELDQVRFVDVSNLQVVSSHLTSLSASNNKLRSSYGVGFGYPNVRHMDLSNNQITSLTNGLTHPSSADKLLSLDVSNNDIRFIPYGFFQLHIQDGDASRVNFDGNPSRCVQRDIVFPAFGSTTHPLIECTCEYFDDTDTLRRLTQSPYCSRSLPTTSLCGVELDISGICNGIIDCPNRLDELAPFCKDADSFLDSESPPNCLSMRWGVDVTHTAVRIANGTLLMDLLDSSNNLVGHGIFLLEEFGTREGETEFKATAAGHITFSSTTSTPSLAKILGFYPKAAIRIFPDNANLTDHCDIFFNTDKSVITPGYFDFPNHDFDEDPGVLQLATTRPFMLTSTLAPSNARGRKGQGGVIAAVVIVVFVLVGVSVFVFYRRNVKEGQSDKFDRRRQLLQLLDEKAQSSFASEYEKLYRTTEGFTNLISSKRVVSKQIQSHDEASSCQGYSSFGSIQKGSFSFCDTEVPRTVMVHILSRKDRFGAETADSTLVQFLIFARVLVGLSRHPNILKVEAFSINRFPLKLATEFLDGGNLFDFLRLRRGGGGIIGVGSKGMSLKPAKRKKKFKNLAENLLLAGSRNDDGDGDGVVDGGCCVKVVKTNEGVDRVTYKMCSLRQTKDNENNSQSCDNMSPNKCAKTCTSTTPSTMTTPLPSNDAMTKTRTPSQQKHDMELRILLKRKSELEQRHRKLKLVETYRQKPEMQDVDNLIQKWRSVCREALEDCTALKGDVSMKQLISHFQIDPELVKFNMEDEEFL